jgi:hypothetical protein
MVYVVAVWSVAISTPLLSIEYVVIFPIFMVMGTWPRAERTPNAAENSGSGGGGAAAAKKRLVTPLKVVNDMFNVYMYLIICSDYKYRSKDQKSDCRRLVDWWNDTGSRTDEVGSHLGVASLPLRNEV